MNTRLRLVTLLAALVLAPVRARADDPAPPAPPPPAPAEPAAPPEPVPPNVRLTPAITPDEVLTRIAFLASDSLEGRESGTDGGRRTENWVAAELGRLGLEPLSLTKDSPFTDVPMAGRPVREQSWIDVVVKDGAPQRIGGTEGAVPFSFSRAGDAEGGLVFAGFGISAPKDQYDDYAGIDVKGKVVLVIRHGPAETDEKSPWHDPRKRGLELAFFTKAQRAADAGAAAILLVNDTTHPEDGLPVDVGGEPSPIPAFAIRRATADLLLAPTGKTFAEMQAAIDAERKPRSAEVPGVSVRVHATVTGTSGRNVVFVRRGSDEKLKDEAILLCAHMDHVGRGFFGANPRSAGQIHNGADDNASGTAALLEAAEAIAVGPAPKRSIVFAAWCGEEKGLVGSEYFTDHPLWDLSKIAVCINMDMVGRYRDADPKDAGVLVEGTPTAVGTLEPVTRLAAAEKLKCTTASWEAWEQSDHFVFYLKGVPSLFIHTGLHSDYHRPADKWWKVAAEPESRIARMLVALARDLADAPARPVFAKKPPRPLLGVRPADADGGAGAKILEITPGLGANAAGLLPEDVITKFNGVKIASASDLFEAIHATKEGDVVEVVYRRGAEEKTVKVRISGI